MIVRFVIWSTVLCLFLVGCKAEVTVENRAYHDLLISFEPNVEAKDAKSLVDSLQVVVEDTSKVLHQAIGYRIASVAFLIPKTWDLSAWEGTAVTKTQAQKVVSDVVVDATADSAFGQHPFSLQHAGCGVKGQHIIVPVEFLKGPEQNGKLLAREWLKYRYGVFDENGFNDDAMYPSSYTIPGTTDIQLTECTDPKLEYIFKDPDGNNCTANEATLWGNCTLVPEEESAAQVKSSLMYFHKDLHNVEKVCGQEHPHNDVTPNKHNLLCFGKSVWDVLQTSSDFASNETSGDYVETEFFFIQEDLPRVVVAWEDSQTLIDKKNSISFGIQRFFYDLPEHSKCALYSFDNDLTEALSLTELPPPDQRQLPTIETHFVFDEEVCTSCAVQKALDVFAGDDAGATGGSIILIVGSSSSESDDDVIDRLKNSQFCLTVIVFSDEDSVAGSYEALRAASPCGSVLRLPMSDQEVVSFEKLHEGMRSGVPQSPTDTKTVPVISGEMSSTNSIDIASDPTAKKFTLWVSTRLSFNQIVCMEGDNSVTLTPAVRKSIFSFTLEPFEGEVKCLLKFDKIAAAFTQVQMTTKPGEYFVEDVWVLNTTPKHDTIQRPVIIYAKLHFGRYPVRYVSVLATVNTSTGNEVKVQLVDSGLGDPDITQNDGIYSGYFMEFDAGGEYRVQVSMSDDEGKARIGKNGAERCCGRRVNGEEFDIHPFQRTLRTTFSAIGGKPEDGYPPSRVTDLKIVEFDPTKSITLEWTAPGGAKAHSYAIKTFTSREDAVKNFNDTGHSLNSTFITPGIEGIRETFEFELLELQPNATLYVVVRSANEKGVTSESSNVQAFFVPEDAVPTTVGTTADPGDKDEQKRSVSKKETIGIVVGVLAVIMVVCIYFGVYFFVIKPRREKKAAKEDKAETGTVRQSSRPNVPPGGSFGVVNSVPADVILNHHNQVMNARNEHKDPPIFKEENLESVHSTPSLPENVNRNKNAEYTLVEKRPPNRDISTPADASKSPKRMTVV